MAPKVYVLILSYCNADDTIECLESVLRLDYPEFEVVVCDNASPDNAMGELLRWAIGERLPPTASPPLAHYSTPWITKPIVYETIVEPNASSPPPQVKARLTFIQCVENRGYAGGNNAALRHILQRQDAGYVWIINNDTVVSPNSLGAVVASAQRNARIGLCGSLVRYYHCHERVQACGGGRYNHWLGSLRYMSEKDVANGAQLDYVVGAATLVSVEFLNRVGLMAEDYFLYFEELDWAERGKRKGFILGVCPESVIYHKEGASTGIAVDPRKKSVLADYYVMRSRILFARTFRPWTRPTIYLGILASLVLRLARGQTRNAKAIFRVWWGMLWHLLPPGEKHPVKSI